MRILFVLEHYYPYIGGAEKLFRDLAESLVSGGQEVLVLTTRYDKALPKQEVINGVKVRRIHCFSRYLFTFLSIPQVIRLARKADLIHTTTYNAALPAWIGARITSTPVIVTFHELWGKLWFRLPFASSLAKLAYYLYEQLILRLGFDHFVAVSKFTRTSLIEGGIPSTKVSWIYNGLDYTQFESYHHNPPADFRFTYFGRLGISKGLDLLLPASKRFFAEFPESRLVLIIPKHPKGIFNQVNKLINELQIEANIELKHELSRDALYQTICDSSAVVIPSYSEGFCFVAAETVALGVPIISSGKGALTEVVTGKHVKCAELTVDGVLEAICKAYEGRWKEVPEKFFRLKDAVKQYLDLYEELQ